MISAEENEKRKLRNWKLLRRAMVGAVHQTREVNRASGQDCVALPKENGENINLESIQDQDYFQIFYREVSEWKWTMEIVINEKPPPEVEITIPHNKNLSARSDCSEKQELLVKTNENENQINVGDENLIQRYVHPFFQSYINDIRLRLNEMEMKTLNITVSTENLLSEKEENHMIFLASLKKYFEDKKFALCKLIQTSKIKEIGINGDETSSDKNRFELILQNVSMKFINAISDIHTMDDGKTRKARDDKYLIQSPYPDYETVKYHLGADKKVQIRRRKINQLPSLVEIFSRKVFNVDNTGNVRIWGSEELLLKLLIDSNSKFYLPSLYHNLVDDEKIPTCPLEKDHVVPHFKRKIRVLELGGGQTALAALGLVAFFGEENIEVCATDGNPSCVKNIKVCAQLNRFQSSVKGQKLLWDKEDKLGEMQSIIDNGGLFDLIIGPDILFFEEYHMDLLHVLKSCLSNQNGKILLLQPHRGGSLDRFMGKAASVFPSQQSFITSVYEDGDLNDIILSIKRKVHNEREYDTLIPSLLVIENL